MPTTTPSPAHIKEHIEIIKPTVHFNHRPSPKVSTKLHRRAGPNLGSPSVHTGSGPKQAPDAHVRITPNLANCDQFITPDCLRALYSINYKPIATKKIYLRYRYVRFVTRVGS